MNINRIDLNLFIVLDAIYTEGSLTRAAQRLHLSQPAISHALGRLRKMLDDPLFVRQGGTMIPTALTRNLITPVRSALATLTSSINLNQPFEPAISERQLTIGLRDVLEAMSVGSGPRKVFVSLGYSSWAKGQLESEITENSWLTVPADPALIFDTPVEERYEKAMGLLGLQPWMLSPDAGHA